MDTVRVTLLDLPIELLDKICEYLTFFEIMTFGDTNKHLKAVTARVLATQTELNLMSFVFGQGKDENGKLFLNAATRALRTYGHNITKLKSVVLERPPAKDIFPVILKYCSGGTLIELNLGDLADEHPKIIASLQPILQHLKSLTLEHFDLCCADLELILAHCTQLEELKLDLLLRMIDSLQNIYPINLSNQIRNVKKPLKKLSLNLSEHTWNRRIMVTNLLEVLRGHRELRIFKIKGFAGEKIDTNILNELTPGLEGLALRYIDNEMKFHPLLKLCHLKCLDITVEGSRLNDFVNFVQVLAVQNTLESLSLQYSPVDDVSSKMAAAAMRKILDTLSQLTSLATLKIDRSIAAVTINVCEYAARIPNLKKFHLGVALVSFLVISELELEVRRQILSLVRVASKIQTLCITGPNYWPSESTDFYEVLVRVRRNNNSETVLHIYDYLDGSQFFNKKVKAQYKRMKSNFVNVFPVLNQKYP